MNEYSPQLVDFVLFVIVNVYNLLMVGIFLSRPLGRQRLETRLGLVTVALAFPVAGVAVLNAVAGRPWWTYVLPALLVAFLLLEWVLDYGLGYDFRRTWVLGPYLLAYYVSLWGMIGYLFLSSRIYGAIALTTYFLSLGATLYSYRKVGHGTRERMGSP